jgi:protein-disulfide isomerase/uncharacterized membrane protein
MGIPAARAETASSPAATTAVVPSRGGVGPEVFAAGLFFLAVAIVGSGIMAWGSLRGISAVPGCGPGSACADMAASKWGSLVLGGIKWPVSYLGLAYFSAMLVAWGVRRGALGSALRWVALAGALASAAFVGIMLGSEKGLCRYCMVTHVGNFGFIAVLMATGGVGAIGISGVGGLRRRPLAGGVLAAVLFAATTAGLAVADSTLRKEVQQQAQAELSSSMAEIKAAMEAQRKRDSEAGQGTEEKTSAATAAPQSSEPAVQPVTADGSPPAPTASSPPIAPSESLQTGTTAAQPPAAALPAASASKGFTGRWRFGPEQAGVRVVLFTGYQCPDCKRVEGQLESLLAKYPNISVSVKHFPFCTECNSHAPNLHPNACWAARAAETAGILGGSEAFRKMHQWLFEKNGLFLTQQELEEGIRRAGLETAPFLGMMTSEAPLKNIQADIDEAMTLGIGSTPFVFINGVELKGWNAKPTSVQDSVEGLAMGDPPVAGPENDHPPRAFAKFIADWRATIAMGWPSRPRPYAMGPSTAKVKVTLFGDLLEPYTAEADRTIREYIVGREDVRYEFRYFPVDPSCNPNVPSMTQGCRAAKAAEAAGQLGGDQAYWRVHEWIVANQKGFNDDALQSLARSIGANAETFRSKMESSEVAAVIASDVDIGKRIGIPSIPRIFVNGKLVPRWQLPGGGVLETIIEEAAKDPVEAEKPVMADPMQLLRGLQR